MTAIRAAAGLLEPLVVDFPMTLVLVASAVVLTGALAASLVAAAARRRRKESEAIVLLLEEMRSGTARKRIELDARSPYASIAASANRLGHDLSARWSHAEAANEGFQALQEAARGYAVIATDGDGDVMSVSPSAQPLFGWDEDAIVGRNAALLFDESAWKDLLPKLARKSLRERGIETRALMLRQDGSRFHARLVVRVLRGRADEIPGFLLVVHDVSEQVRVETELREAENRSRGLLESLPVGVALVEHGKIAYANPVSRSLLGLADQAVGIPLRERIATSHVLIVQDALTRLEAAPAGTSVEANVTLADGKRGGGRDVRFVAVSHPVGDRPAALVLLRDETSERRLVRTLASTESRLDAVLDAWEDGVLVVEDDAFGSRVRLVNRAFAERFGLPRAPLFGITEAELIRKLRERGPHGAAAASCLASAVSGQSHEEVAFEGRDLALWAASAPAADGAMRVRMLAVRDVTSELAARRAQAEETEEWKQRHEAAMASFAALQAMHDELEQRRDEAEKLNGELRALDGMKSELLANVSHELQTPLVSIRGYTEMILKGRLGAINEEQKKGLTLSLKNIDRLIAMIDNLLAFARTDRDTGPLAVSTFPLLAAVDEALALLQPRIEEKKIRMTLAFDDPALAVRADRDKILQVLLNLIGNAVKFNREEGAVEIGARPGKPGSVVVQVRDTGVGIGKDDLEKIFDRFYRAEEGARKKEGAGIGLAIVRNILRLHGCVIHAASDPGAGTVFTFTLPAAAGASEKVEVAEPRREDPDARATPPTPGPHPSRPERPAPASNARPRLRIIRRG